MSYKDVLASFGASSDVRNFPGTFEDEPNNHHRSSLRSPAPSGGLLGTSADSAGTGGSAPGLGSSIWAMGSSGNNGSAATIRDPSNKMSPQMSWSAMDSFSGDRGASLLGPPTPAAAFWDAGPVPGVDHSGDLESDFNRSFETLALEDGPVASGLMGQGLYTPGSVSPNTAVSSTYATPHRPGRDSFSANAAAANGVPARNLLSTPPNKAFTAPYAPGQQGSADSSPAAAFGFGASPIPLAGQSAPSTPRRALQTYGADASQYQSGRANVQGLGMGAPYISTSSPYLPPQAATDMLSNWRSPLPRQLLDMSPQSQQMPFHDALSNAKVRDHDIPTRSLWIGNLDPAVDAAMLVRIFSVFGPIESLRVLHDRDCAFVNFTDITSALRARSQMEGSRIGSQVVRMGFGRIERDERIEQQPTRSVWIGNLPTGVEIEDLMATFNRFGPIESARVLVGPSRPGLVIGRY